MKQKLIIFILLLTLTVVINVKEGLCGGTVRVTNNCGACDVATVALVCVSTPCGSGFVPNGESRDFEVPSGPIVVKCSCNERVEGHIEKFYDTIITPGLIFLVNFTCGINDSPRPCSTSALFGEDSEEVRALRLFRDAVLSQSHEGQELIKLYYQWSPAIVRAMEADEEFKQEIKDMIDEILPMISQ
jgi:hypothetical protein